MTKKEIRKMDFFLFGSLPTLEQAQECVEQHKHRHKRKLLNFHNYPVYKWPMPIIYKYDGTHGEWLIFSKIWLYQFDIFGSQIDSPLSLVQEVCLVGDTA